jgi:transposase
MVGADLPGAAAVDPFCGWLFVFCNRRRTAVKILTYDGQGFWLATKRLSQGKFPYWPTDGPIQELQAHQLQVLLMGADPLQGTRRVGVAAITAGGLIEDPTACVPSRG